MSITVKNRHLILGAFLLICATFFIGWLLGRQNLKDVTDRQISALEGKIHRMSIQIDEDLVYTAKVEQELTTQKELVRKGVVEKEALRKLNIKHLNEIDRLNMVIDTLLEDVEHGGQVITVHDTVYKEHPQKAILLPFSFEKKDEFIALGGNFNSQGKLDISLKVKADVDVYTGISKKTKEPFCIVTSPSPYLNIINVQSYKTDVKKPTRFAIGFNVGYGLSKSGLSPYVGVGLSRNLITF